MVVDVDGSQTARTVGALEGFYDIEARAHLFRRPSYYVQFLATEPESTLKLATLNRTDLKEGDSHVIAITSHGGLALHPYLYTHRDGKFLYAFDRRRFLQLALNYTGSHKGEKVMCLFKSEDGQSKTENEIKWHIEPFLGKSKTLIYHDASKSIPSLELSEQADVFISWFRGSSMPEAKEYLRWLSSRAYLGSKILIFGNMGAFQDKSLKEWLSLKEINLLYGALGLEYGGQWTGDAKLLEHVGDVQDFFYLNMNSMVERIHHYQKVELKHPVAESLLTIQRTDLKDSQSSLIAITPFGGYAEGPYIFCQHKSHVEPLLKLELFVHKALGLPLPK